MPAAQSPEGFWLPFSLLPAVCAVQQRGFGNLQLKKIPSNDGAKMLGPLLGFLWFYAYFTEEI
jgi:hypothetical protein